MSVADHESRNKATAARFWESLYSHDWEAVADYFAPDANYVDTGLGESLGDGAALIGAVAGFSAGIGLVAWHSRQHRDDNALQPTLLEVLPPADALRWSD